MKMLIGPVVIALILSSCGGASHPAAATPSPLITAAAAATPAPTPVPTYAPTAEGFTSKVLVEKPHVLSASAPSFISIVVGTGADASGVTAVVSDRETFTAAYQPADERRTTAAAYATPDLPSLPAGRYTEGLRLVVVQAGGRSAAHMHSGLEGVLVLEGRVLVRSGGSAPTFLEAGQGFYILPKVPVQLINIGTGLARTLVYSMSPEGSPYTTELSQAP